MTQLTLNLIQNEQTSAIPFNVKRMINAGYVGRNIEAVQAHIDELAQEGVPAPSSIPMIFPVLSKNITTGNRIEIVGDKTSGEAEYAVIFKGDRIFIGVGSDHTDREVESISISTSKQICENVLSPSIWDFEDVRDHWDELILRSWVKTAESEAEILYQNAPLGSIISAEDLIALVTSKLKDANLDGLIIFSGTVPVVTEKMIYGTYFRCEIADERLGRSLICEYDIEKLEFLRVD